MDRCRICISRHKTSLRFDEVFFQDSSREVNNRILGVQYPAADGPREEEGEAKFGSRHIILWRPVSTACIDLAADGVESEHYGRKREYVYAAVWLECEPDLGKLLDSQQQPDDDDGAGSRRSNL